MHGPTRIFWANLTAFSPQALLTVDEVTSILEGFMGDTGNACEYVDAVLKPVLGEKFAAYTIQVTFSVRGPLRSLFRRRVV